MPQKQSQISWVIALVGAVLTLVFAAMAASNRAGAVEQRVSALEESHRAESLVLQNIRDSVARIEQKITDRDNR